MESNGQAETEGLRIGKYRVLRRLAIGGMGEVFLARHDGPGGFSKTVVVKRILAHLAEEPAFVEMFLNEARLAALVSHPNVVQIFELGEDNGSYFIAMEYVAGRSMRAIASKLQLRRRNFDPILAARLASQALHGLHHAHDMRDERGQPLLIVHRDVTPDNILIGKGGVVKLLDFGIAKAVAASGSHTGSLRGKFAFMSPEQLTGQPIDRRADIYSMGAVLYEMVTGHLPYTGVHPGVLVVQMEKAPVKPSVHNPNVTAEFDQILLTALAANPSERFQTAEEMANALAEFASRHSDSLSPSQVDAFLDELFGSEPVHPLPGAAVGGTRPVGMGEGERITSPGSAVSAANSRTSEATAAEMSMTRAERPLGTSDSAATRLAVFTPAETRWSVEPAETKWAVAPTETRWADVPAETRAPIQATGSEVLSPLEPIGIREDDRTDFERTASHSRLSQTSNDLRYVIAGVIIAVLTLVTFGGLWLWRGPKSADAEGVTVEQVQPDEHLANVERERDARSAASSEREEKTADEPPKGATRGQRDADEAAKTPVRGLKSSESTQASAREQKSSDDSAQATNEDSAQASARGQKPSQETLRNPTRSQKATADESPRKAQRARAAESDDSDESKPSRSEARTRRSDARASAESDGRSARGSRTGKVVVRVFPWAEIFHAGKSVGTTPMGPLTLPAGKQQLILRNSELQVEKAFTVNVPAGGEVPLNANLMEEAPAASRR